MDLVALGMETPGLVLVLAKLPFLIDAPRLPADLHIQL